MRTQAHAPAHAHAHTHTHTYTDQLADVADGVVVVFDA